MEQQVDSSLLMLEITESVAMENPEEMKELICEFHKMGLKVSMDDFGSGYSSLNALKALPFDELKLDRSFFLPSQTPERDEVIVRKMIELAQALQIKTVAEGVEKTAQEKLLKEAGCLCVQGYLYAKPMPVADFETLAFGSRS